MHLARLAPVLGVLFLLAQAGAVAHEHLGPTRYFAWAPNDYIVEYDIRVTVDGRPLDAAQINARYGHLYGMTVNEPGQLDLRGVWEFPVRQLEDVIEQYEKTYGHGQRASVTLDYRLDRRSAGSWTWSG